MAPRCDGKAMKFHKTRVSGAFVIEPEPHVDARGSFARMWCREEFQSMGLNAAFVQGNRSLNHKRGTLRGLHYQKPPHQEVKLVSCVRGAIYDVIVDLRPQSTSYREWLGIELSSESGRSLYVPAGCAHGFQTLIDDSEVIYLVTAEYEPSAEGGLRYSDPRIAIAWPLPVTVISEKDRSWPLLG